MFSLGTIYIARYTTETCLFSVHRNEPDSKHKQFFCLNVSIVIKAFLVRSMNTKESSWSIVSILFQIINPLFGLCNLLLSFTIPEAAKAIDAYLKYREIR